MGHDSIQVTKAFLPPMEEYQALLDGIWERGWLTNHGPLAAELEARLSDHLGIGHVLFVSNGTIALQLAIRAMGLWGEVITTPFSYVATTSALVWEQCRPVMVDIDPRTLTIDPERIEAAITPKTTGIVATHVYGNACDVAAIAEIGERHGLPVLYDAAHAFGAALGGKSLASYGNASTLSFHATKLFHTVEGGAVCTDDPAIAEQVGLFRNFGHLTPNSFGPPGINGKNSEFHAAMGLANLPHVSEIIRSRAKVVAVYDSLLVEGPFRRPERNPALKWNYAYYPFILDNISLLERVVAVLNEQNVFPRRYFYPSLSELSYVERRHETPVSDSVAPRVLCLPLSHSLDPSDAKRIALLVLQACAR